MIKAGKEWVDVNRLRQLRKQVGLSTRALAKYTGIAFTTITYLENEKRAFRQSHIDSLTSFFNVTSDYLLGRNDYGFIVHTEIGDDTLIFTEIEYQKLCDSISEEIIYIGEQASVLNISNKEEKTVFIPTHCVYRELRGTSDNYDLKDTLCLKLTELSKRMTSNDLKKAIKFIEDYIIK